jgi:reactive intermediate/imine deaminase
LRSRRYVPTPHQQSLESTTQVPVYYAKSDTSQAQVIKNIGAVLEEAGTSWEYVMKTTVFLANMSDYTAMNAVYGAMLPSPKPARTAVEVGKLPGNFLIEIEAIAAIPDS